MPTPILATKLYIPPPRPNFVARPRLIDRLNTGLHRKLTLISAAAGFGKTTLVGEWVSELRITRATGPRDLRENDDSDQSAGARWARNSEFVNPQVAWLSLDEGDSDLSRFLTYFVAALQRVAPQIGKGLLGLLQSPQPPPSDVLLTALLNELTTLPDQVVLILDDYHLVDAKAVDEALTFLLEHLPPQLHLVIATREDPNLPLARLRARGQLCELRIGDLRFTQAEAADFLNEVMALNLTAAEIAALENRTEGWVAGLQLAAISMQGQQDTTGFIKSFTGSHRFVMDYLLEEVLHQQPATIQTFLLHTSILDRLCGPLCEAVLGDAAIAGQRTLEYLEQANLFIIPLDNERRWYRYHHLFAELLRQRLDQSQPPLAALPGEITRGLVAELHIRASAWYEAHSLAIEAFHHAAAANDFDRAERLIEGAGIPRHFRGAVTMILDWLGSLPTAVLDARPSLWWKYGSLLLVNGQTTGVEEKLAAAEAALLGPAVSVGVSDEPDAALDDKSRNLVGQIAAARATLALTRYQADTILVQSRRALAYLHPNNLTFRSTAKWAQGFAHYLQGDRAAAGAAYTAAVALGQAAGDTFTTILATTGLANVQEIENQLHLAAQSYRQVLHWAGEQPLQIIYDAQLGLARVLYEWNDLAAAEQHGRQSLHLAQQYDQVIDRFIVCELFLARVKLAQNDVDGAALIVAQAEQATRQKKFVHRIPEVAAAQVLVLLRQGQLTAAAHVAQRHELPISQIRVHLAQGETAAALGLLVALRQQLEARHWQDELLKVMVLQAVALHTHGENDQALQLLGEALTLARPEGFIRLFVDEGLPMATLLTQLQAAGTRYQLDKVEGLSAYIQQLLAALAPQAELPPASPLPSPLIEPLSQRELEVLRLIAQGLSNQAIGAQLFLALDTVKGHNRRIFDKLQVQRRTEAVARARALGLL